MSSDDNSDDEKAPPMPSFSGNVMPMNVTINVDEDDIGEETTRRIGGATFNPTFEPVSFAPSNMMSPSSSYISTTQQKVSSVAVAAPPSGGWKLTSAPILPEFHPLDRNSVFCSGTSASEVAERVAQVLKERSIEAHFDNSKAKVRCLTAYNVDFRVFLYRGQKQYAHGTIVEVQRRTGASVLFVKDTQAILEAAQGNFVAPPPPPALFSTAEIPLVSDTEDDDDDDYDDNNEASLSSLDFCAKLFNYKNHGSDMLALQTLASLTDPAKMGLSTSKRVSRALVEPNSTVGSRVFALIVDSKNNNQDDSSMIRNLAMTILSNTIQSVQGDLNPMMREALRPVLIQELKKAEDNPQMAYLAAKCFEPLIAGDHFSSELYDVLDTAQSIGEARHAALRDVCEKCIQKVK